MAMVPLSEEEGPGPSRFRQALVPFFCFFFVSLGQKNRAENKKKTSAQQKRVPNTRNRGCAIDCGPENFSAKSPPPRRLGLSAVSAPPPRFLCAPSALSLRRSVRGAGGTEKKTRQGGAHSPPWALQRVTRTCGLASMQCDLLSDGGEEDELEGGEVATLGGRGVPLLRVSEAFPSSLSGGGEVLILAGTPGPETRPPDRGHVCIIVDDALPPPC